MNTISGEQAQLLLESGDLEVLTGRREYARLVRLMEVSTPEKPHMYRIPLFETDDINTIRLRVEQAAAREGAVVQCYRSKKDQKHLYVARVK